MAFNLYQFQEFAVDLLISQKRQLLAYDMGLGKTIIALSAAEKLNLPTLVICPAFMKATWEREFKNFKIDDIRINTWANIKFENPTVLIVDESHYGKNPESQRTIAFLEVAKRVRGRSGYVWLLSGTPAKNSAAELYCQLIAVGLEGYPTYLEFADEFSESFLAKYSQMSRPVVKHRGVRNLEKLRNLYAPLMHVLKAKDVLDLPLQIKKKIISNFSVFKEEDVAEFRSDAESFMKKNFSTKKLQQAQMNISTTKSLVEELKMSFEKIIIFSDHVSPARDFANHFECGLITGEVPIEKRESVIKEFKDNGSVLSCTIGSAGVGLNLQFANCIVFSDSSWSAADMMQAEKRIHRIGQQDHCHYFYVVDSGLGEVIHETVQRKMELMEKLK